MQTTIKYIIIGISIAIIVFLFISSIIVSLVINYRNKQKKNKIEKQLMQQQFQQQLLQTQLEIQEQTFNAISQEIHDNVGQILSLAKVQMNIAEEQQNNNPFILKDVKENINRALEELRGIAKNLSTDRIEELDFLQILQTEIDRINKLKNIQCSLTITGANKKIGTKYKLIIFRIIQETINNILKHAKATQINIAINFLEKQLITIVTDNGIGFNTTIACTGLGLQSITKRAALIGGNALIKSEINKGTSITLNIPYE